MSSFGGINLTNRGRALQLKAQAGTQIKYTRISVGDGQLGGRSPLDLNALISEKKSLAINKCKLQLDGTAVVGAVLSNQDVQAGFYWREVGVYALDPDAGEILFCYANGGTTAEYIPATGGPEVVEKQIDIVTIVGNATNVTAVLDKSLLFASAQDLQAHVGDKSNPHGVTAAQVCAIPEAMRGEPGGVAALDEDGLLIPDQFPPPSAYGALPAGVWNQSVRIDPAYEMSSDTRSVSVTNGTNGLISGVTVTDPTSNNATVAANSLAYGSNGLVSKVTTTVGAHKKTVTINYGSNGLFSGLTKTFV
ncbi:phage tail protein [Tumebacillus flagellatus]|uniref:Phage tail fibre protein N-terminal domain-containing protein n=1 Tax=Tumebacillus flagellatus TaxID=1157490 RepID=A0A074MGB1_9BACL|nr:phage tail protein [Tumebacillus flagellatus]KEO84747.1 hypothetical protein EL26_01690 [Tumebacillus flagellatus]